MADYVLLYSGGRMPESEDEQAQVMKAWEGPVQVNRGRHARSQAMPVSGRYMGVAIQTRQKDLRERKSCGRCRVLANLFVVGAEPMEQG